MEDLTFPELQRQMQLEKGRKEGVNYAFRNAEQIYTKFKELDSGWIVILNDELIEISNRLFVRTTAVARKGDEQYTSTAYAEHNTVPVFKTGNKQMQEPQWTGAVSSYARKYALQGLFAIGEKDVDEYQAQDEQQNTQNHQTQNNQSQQSQYINDAQVQQIYNGINQLAQMTNQNPDMVASGILVNYNIKDFHEVPSEFFNEVVNYIKSLMPQQNKTNFNDL
ncbi:ERF family protein [Streptococcus gallolyticus subsp. gallolyticus]|uniref:ERF family protein n=1 Tax=Streptococcus gallolyticus TaxID=315405 RepID=UPI002284416C|nr:ERF family protein [Streptococcus gallolyticus]MCY7152211.1 ERF family protein [Streptococcus gallolyticus subsp. gallolyticus]